MRPEAVAIIVATVLLFFIVGAGVVGGALRLGLRRPLRWFEIAAAIVLGLPVLSLLFRFALAVIGGAVYLITGQHLELPR